MVYSNTLQYVLSIITDAGFITDVEPTKGFADGEDLIVIMDGDSDDNRVIMLCSWNSTASSLLIGRKYYSLADPGFAILLSELLRSKVATSLLGAEEELRLVLGLQHNHLL